MIGRANTGGGITLHVIGGTTKPLGAGGNTIWLNTAVTITDWCVQNAAPENPEEGDVYITTRYATDNALNISNPHAVTLYLGTARQWQIEDNEGKWMDLQGEVYYDGAWHKLNTYVYDGTLNDGEGNFNTNPNIGGNSDPEETSVWEVHGNASTKITSEEDHFVFSTVASITQYCNTRSKIDFTDIKEVKFSYSRTTGGNRAVRFVAFENVATTASAEAEVPLSNTKTTATLDTSGLSGFYYLGYRDIANTSTGTLNVYEIELIS